MAASEVSGEPPRRGYALLLAAPGEPPADCAEVLSAALGRPLVEVRAGLAAGAGLLAERLTAAAAQRAGAALRRLGVGVVAVPTELLVPPLRPRLVRPGELTAEGLVFEERSGRPRRVDWSRVLLVDAAVQAGGSPAELVDVAFEAALPLVVRLDPARWAPGHAPLVELCRRLAEQVAAERLTERLRAAASGAAPAAVQADRLEAELRWRLQLARLTGGSAGLRVV